MAEHFFPSAIVCSCGKRFESEWSVDADAVPLRRQLPYVASALWQFLQHHAARLIARSGPTRAHTPERVLIGCGFCAESIDVVDYRQHLIESSCHPDADLAEAVRLYRESSVESAKSPTFKCTRCVQRDPVRSFSLGALLEHSHRFKLDAHGVEASSAAAFELYMSCRACPSDVPLSNASGHALFWHADRIQQSPNALADLYVTFPVEGDAPPAVQITSALSCNETAACLALASAAGDHPTAAASENPDPAKNPCGKRNPSEVPTAITAASLTTTSIRLVLTDSMMMPDNGGDSKSFCLFECEQCGWPFANKAEMLIHAAAHAKARPYRCDQCGAKLPTLKAHRRHVARHKTNPNVVCPVCKKTLSDKYYLAHHLAIHSGERPHKCSTCQKTFARSTHLKRHERVHTGERPLTCYICQRTFIDYTQLHDHIRRHTGERPYACTQCDKTFTSAGNLRGHNRGVHWGIRPYRCVHDEPHGECGKAFTSNADLQRHIRTAHTREQLFECDQCDKGYAQRDRLVLHMRSHTGERPFACQECDKAYQDAQHLAIHMRRHRGERPYVCVKCDKSFVTSGNLRQHNRTRACMLKHAEDYDAAAAGPDDPAADDAEVTGEVEVDALDNAPQYDIDSAEELKELEEADV